MANNQIKIGVGFQVDKSGLNDLISSLRQIQHNALAKDPTGNLKTGLNESAKAAEKLENILNKSWNSKLNQLDLSKVSQGIKETYGNVNKMKTELEKSGAVGINAYNHMASAILNTNLQLKQSNKLLDEMATSMANTVKWGITSSIFNTITSSISQAYTYTKKLDSSLNDIRIVTDKSAESMEKFARQANNAAKGLGASTLDYTEASLIYYQQGLDDADVESRTETTLKAANVTGQYAEEVSEQLTAVWNGYKVSAQEAELYVDKLAAVAASTAADLEELSTGMSKVASAANSMGVDIDQLNAQLATIVSVTRQAPESVGTALKTIYARMSDLKLGGTDEDGLGLGDVSGTMASMGIQVLDASGNLREMGDVIEEVASKWDTWTEAQKTAMAQVMAGKRQYNNLVALFENWDMYTDSINESTNAAGTLQKQQDIYLESTKAHLQQLRTEAEKTYDILFNQDVINGFTDVLTGTLNLFNNFIDSFGGGASSIIALGGIVANVFHKQIGKSISGQIDNIQKLKNNADAQKLKEQIIINHQSKGENIASDNVLDKEVENTKKILSVQQQLSQEKANELIKLQEQIAVDQQRLEDIDRYKQIAKDLLDIENAELMLHNGLNQEFSDGIERKEEEIQLNRSSLRLYQDINHNQTEIFDSLEHEYEIREALFDMIDATTEAERANIDIYKLEDDITYNRRLTEEQIQLLQKGQNRLGQEREEQLRQLRIGAQGVADAENDVRQELEDQVEARQKLFDQEISSAEQQASIENLVQGLTGLFSVITSGKSAFEALSNSTLTTEEMFKQFGTAAAATIGLLISNFNSIKNIGKNTTGVLLNVFNTIKGTSHQSLKEVVASAGGWKALSASILKTKISLLGFKVALGPLAAGIAVVTAAIYAGIKVYNAKRDAMLEEQAALEKTKEAYQKTKEAYDELISSLEDYNGARKAIDSLKEGTIEWSQAVDELNQKILELMSLYPELAQYVTVGENGVMEINQQGQEYIKQQQLLKTQAALQTQYQQQAVTNKVTEEVKIEEIARNNNFLTEDIIQDFLNNTEGISTKSTDQEIINFLTKKSEEKGGTWGESSDEVKTETVQQLRQNTGNFNDIYGLRKLTNIAQQQLTTSIMSSSELFKDVDNDILTAITRKNQDKINQQKEQEKQNLNLKSAEDYAKAAGLSGESFSFDTKTQEVIAKNNAGEEIARMSKEVVEETEAMRRAVQNVYNDIAQSEIDTIKDLQSEADKLYQGLGNYMSSFMGGSAGSFSGATGAEMRGMESFLTEDWFIKNAEAYGFTGVDGWKLFQAEFENAQKHFWENYNGIDLAKTMINTANVTAEVQKALSAGDELTDTQLAHLNQLEAKYTELAAIKDKSSHEYLELLRQITEQEENNARKELRIQRENDEAAAESLLEQMKAKQALLDGDGIFSEETKQQFEMEIIALDEQFNETMDRLRENNKELEIAIKADIETDIQEGFGIVDEFKKLQDIIPDDLKLTVDEAEKIMADGYGAILNDSEALGDNQIKINKQVLNDYVDTKQAELEASRQAKIAELDMQIASFETQHQLLTQQAEAYRKAAEAKDADSYAKAMAEATRLNQQYQAEVHLLDQKLQREEEFTTGKEETYSQYYKDLTGMYEKDSQNEQKAENAAAKNEAESTKNRIENANKLYEAYLAVGDARQYAQGATTDRPNYTVDSETYWKADTEAVNTESQQEATKNEASTGVNIQSLEEFFKQLYEENKAAAIDEAKASADYSEKKAEEAFTTKGKLEGMKSILESAGLSLNTAQSKAGTKDGKDKKEEKKAEDEIDRYWELNKAIENVEESLSDLDKQQEKLYGKEKINSLKEENQLLAQQADRYRALAAEQRKEAGELQGILSNYGVVFDAQGAVSNYLAATQAMLNQYNQAVAAYNAGLIDEATFGVTEKAYENFKATLERYETLYYNEMRETQNKLDEIHRQELENNLEAWEIEIQLKLDMKELKRQWNDFFKEINENFKLVYEDLGATMNNLVKNSKTYVGKDGDIATIRKVISDVTKEIDKMRSGGSSDMFESISQAQEKLKELNEQLMDSARSLRDLWEEAWDTYLEGIDQTADKFEDIMEQYERANEQIEYQKELIELLYGDEAYDLMSEYYDAQLENTLGQVSSLKQQADMWKKQYEIAKAIDEQNGTTSEDTKKFYEEWQEAQDQVNDKVKEYIKLLQDEYKNTIKSIFSDLEKYMTGGTNFDYVKEEWDLLQKQVEGYYDDIEKVYQLNTLANKYEKSIANTTGVNNQKKLQELYDKEMNYLENKKDLSEYDIEIANAKYEMTLKQIALEEAQQNKNAMKLTRGADGNWSYQYVANEEEVQNKQQELLDATNNYYKIAKEGFENNLEEIMSIAAEWMQKLEELEMDRVTGAISEEMYQKQKQLYENTYSGLINKKSSALGDFKNNIADATLQSTLNSYKVNLESYEWMTEEQKLLLNELKNGTFTNYDEMLNKAMNVSNNTLNTWQSTAMQIADLWYNNPTSIKQEIVNAYMKIEQANKDYQNAIDELERTAEQDFGEDGIKGAIDDARKATKHLEDATKQLVKTAEKELPKYREQVNKIEQAWYGVKNGIEASIATIAEYLNYVGETKKAADDMAISMQKAADAIQKAADAQKALNNAKKDAPLSDNEKSLYYYRYMNKDDYDEFGHVVGLYQIFLRRTNTVVDSNITLEKAKKKYGDALKAYNTGGYTGEWNNGDVDGRLAWLHQKELVLNSADTANILSVVDTVRDLTKIGSSIESSIMSNISKMLFNLMNLGNYGQSYQPQLVTSEGTTENIFHINAEFPNADDVSSIREAIMSLPNLASQYIARNKK